MCEETAFVFKMVLGNALLLGAAVGIVAVLEYFGAVVHAFRSRKK